MLLVLKRILLMLGKMHPLRFTSKKTLGLLATDTTIEKALESAGGSSARCGD